MTTENKEKLTKEEKRRKWWLDNRGKEPPTDTPRQLKKAHNKRLRAIRNKIPRLPRDVVERWVNGELTDDEVLNYE